MTFLTQALIFLAAAVVCVPIAKRMGMGSVLGYLIAGMLIGPFILGLVGNEGEDIMHFAEFGVVMMLFIIGLELEPSQFWKMRKSIAGMGSIQVAGTSALIFAGFIAAGLTWKQSLTASLAFAMSSTAIVLQTIREKGLSQTAAGQSAFAVLLFQDIMVIPVLAILPLLAADVVSSPAMSHGETQGWMQGLMFAGAVVLIIVAGRFLIVPLLRIVARTHLRELFTASSLLLVVAVAILMQKMGLSPALGTFLAGVVLANSEYRHELESDLEPFKGLLLGLFFIGVGASINFSLIATKPLLIALVVLGVMTVKFFVLMISGKFFSLSSDQNILYSFSLSQVGEFAFVILSYSGQLAILDREWTDILMASTAITMTITPLLLLLNEKFIDPRFGVRESIVAREADTINEHNEVIIAGFGHFGSTAGRFLKANGVNATILDHDSDRVRLLRNMGFKVYYGDATRVDLLVSAGAEKARILIAAIDPPETNQELISIASQNFPHLKILARARNRVDAYDLIELGVTNIYRESLHTSVKLAVDALVNLGHRSYTATRLGQKFIEYDEQTLKEMALHRHDMKQYVNKARETFRIQEEILQQDRFHGKGDEDHAWDSDQIKEKLR